MRADLIPLPPAMQFVDRIVRPCTSGAAPFVQAIAGSSGNLEITTCTGKAVTVNGVPLVIVPGGGIGGSTGAFDNRVLRSDGVGGVTLQNSLVVVDDTGNTTTPGFVATGSGGGANGALDLLGLTSGTVTVTVANVAGTWQLTLPTTAGTNGQFLQTNGSGVTSWQTASGGLTCAGCTNNFLTKTTGAGALGNSVISDVAGVVSINGIVVTPNASALWNPNAPPTSAGALDDEFTTQGAGVPAGWTEFDPNGLQTVSVDQAGLVLTQTGSVATREITGIYKTLPAGNFTFSTLMSWLAFAGNADVAGLCFWEDPTDPTKRLVLLNAGGADGSFIFNVTKYTDYQTLDSTIADWAPGLPGGPVYARMRRAIGSPLGDYFPEFSGDGIGFVDVSDGGTSFGFTPTAVGLIVGTRSATVASSTARFPFFRYKNSDVGTGILEGNRIGIGGIQGPTGPAGPSTSPGGANTQVQFNDSGVFGGDAGLTYNKTTDSLTIAGELSLAKTLRSGTASNTDLAGQLTIGGGGTITYTFTQTYASAPVCVSSDTDPVPSITGASASTTVLTVTGTVGHVVNYVCVGRN